MGTFRLAWIALAGFICFSSAASAAVITEDIGTLSDATPFASYGYDPVTAPDFRLDAGGQGTFRVNFTLGSLVDRTATSITASAAVVTALKTFTFGLYDAGNNLLKQVDQSTAIYSSTSGTTASLLDFANLLQAGKYYLLLAVTAGNAHQIINGNINIATAPIPASLPLFGAALVALMVFRWQRQRKAGLTTGNAFG